MFKSDLANWARIFESYCMGCKDDCLDKGKVVKKRWEKVHTKTTRVEFLTVSNKIISFSHKLCSERDSKETKSLAIFIPCHYLKEKF